jgi:RHS repeat-associated protein
MQGLDLLGVQQGGHWYYPHTDALGSIRRWSDATGASVGRLRYDPFGNLVAQQGTRPVPLGFTGEWHDPVTGLQYLRARWYQPQTGRFTQVDPFPGVQSLPGTQHPYVYGLNNPTRYTDPSGEFPWLLLGAAAIYATGGAAYNQWVPDVTQGFTGWHVIGYLMGYENIRQDWKTLMNPCVSGLKRAFAAVDIALNVTLGVTLVYGWLNAFRAVYAAGQLMRTGTYGGAVLQWGDKFFRPLGSGIIRAPQLPTTGARGIWNYFRLLGGIAHEYAHFQQEFTMLAALARPLQRLSVVLEPANNATDIGRIWLTPLYVMNPVELHAAASGFISPMNIILVLESRFFGFGLTSIINRSQGQ